MKRILTLMIGLAAGIASLSAQTMNLTLQDPLTLPASPDYSIEQVNCQSDDGRSLYGVAYIPQGDKTRRYPTLIFSHGFGSSHQYFSYYGTAFARAGIATYMFDFGGGSVISRSEGKTTDMSVLTERDELKSIIRFVRQQTTTDTTRLFLAGESQGGFVTAMTAAEVKDLLRGVILLYSAFHIPEWMRTKFEDNIPDAAPMIMDMTIGRQYIEDARQLDGYAYCREMDKPVIIIHGDNDKAVLLVYVEIAARLYPHADLKVIPGGRHGFVPAEHCSQALDHMLQFLNTNR